MLNTMRIFPCPACNQLISTDAEKCRFCSAPVDPALAQAAADTQDKVNSAYSDAMMIRNLAAGMWVAFLVRFIPFVGIVGWIGMLALLVIVPIKLIVWQARFGRIKTNDPDYKKAKTNRLIAFLVWLPLPLLLLFLFGLVLVAMLASGNR
jgi:hypothetical protein